MSLALELIEMLNAGANYCIALALGNEGKRWKELDEMIYKHLGTEASRAWRFGPAEIWLLATRRLARQS